MKIVFNDVAKVALDQIVEAGFDIEPLGVEKPRGLWAVNTDFLGVKLTAVRDGGRPSSASAHDWSGERAEMEAAVLLARKLNVKLVA